MNIGIIGGGATGLTTARRLSLNSHSVTVYEKGQNTIGGIAGGTPFGKTKIDKFYHHIFTSDTNILSLMEELGISKEMLWVEPKNGMYINNKLYPFTTPMDLIMFPPIRFFSRIKMGLAVLNAKNVKDYKSMENITAKDWLIAKAGQDSYDAIWKRLLYSKFDIDTDKISGVWIWNKFKLRGSTRSNLNNELLGYLRGSFHRLYEVLADDIQNRGGNFCYNIVTKISPAEDGKINVYSNNNGKDKGEIISTYDKVLFTAAPGELIKICNFPQQYNEKVNRIKYKANICMTLVVKEKVCDYYWITIAEDNAPFVLFIEHTNLISDNDYDGKHIIYLSRYIDESDPFFKTSDDEIKKVFLNYVQKLFPSFDQKTILDIMINRSKYAQPVIGLRYSDDVLPYETPIKNLYLACMAQVYPEDRGQNYAVRAGEEVSKLFMEE